jgi:hypothetical protein
VLGWINIAFAALNLALGLALAGMMGVARYSLERTSEAPASARATYRTWALPAAVLESYLIIPSLPALVAGVGLLRWRPWARILTLVLAVFQLPHFPAGTVLAVFAGWVLLNPEVAARFRQAAAAPAAT